jgi:hypothetical protein
MLLQTKSVVGKFLLLPVNAYGLFIAFQFK